MNEQAIRFEEMKTRAATVLSFFFFCRQIFWKTNLEDVQRMLY